MPRVPRAEEQVREAALPGARFPTEAPAAAFGGGQAAAGAAEATRGLAHDVAAFAQDERAAADFVVVQQADLETAKEKLRLLKDPKSGALNVRGQETLGLPDSVGGAFDKYTEGVRERLTTGQRTAYDRLLFGHKRDINDTLQGHMFSEMQKFDETTTKARLETAQEEAALNFHDPEKIGVKIAEQKAILRAHADRSDMAGQSVPPEELARQEAEAASKTQSAVISRLLTAGEYKYANDYYTQVKGDLTSHDAQRIDQAVRSGVVLGSSQKNASDIMGTAKSEGDAFEAARKIEDPEIQKATVDEIRNRYAEQKRVERAAAEQAMQTASNIVEQSQNAAAVPRQLWAQLPISDRRALETRSRQLREGVEPVTDWALYYHLKTKASSEVTRPDFLRENIMAHRPVMANAQFNNLIDLQTSLRKGGDEASRKELDGYRTRAQIVNDGLNAMGVDPTPKQGTDSAQHVATFRNLVEEQVRQVQRQTGREASNKEVQGIVDGLVIKARTPNATVMGIPIPFTGGEKRAYELQATKKSDIPQAAAIKLEAVFKRNGNPNPSDDDMIEAYNLTVRKRIAGAPRAP